MLRQMNERDELLTFKETSEWLRVKVCTLRKWAAERKMPTVRIGRGLRVPLAWIRDTIRKGYLPVVSSDRGDGTDDR